MKRHIALAAVGLAWGAVSYLTVWFSWIPVLGQIVYFPSGIASFLNRSLALGFSSDFGQTIKLADGIYVSLLSSSLFLAGSLITSLIRSVKGRNVPANDGE